MFKRAECDGELAFARDDLILVYAKVKNNDRVFFFFFFSKNDQKWRKMDGTKAWSKRLAYRAGLAVIKHKSLKLCFNSKSSSCVFLANFVQELKGRTEFWELKLKKYCSDKQQHKQRRRLFSHLFDLPLLLSWSSVFATSASASLSKSTKQKITNTIKIKNENEMYLLSEIITGAFTFTSDIGSSLMMLNR